MKAKHLTLSTLFLLATPVASMAADRIVHLPFEQVVAEAQKDGKLDGSVKFYLAGKQPVGKVDVVQDYAYTSKKTNAFGKKDEETCSWVLQSALISLQEMAKRADANAVMDIVSDYNDTEYRDGEKYECHIGFLMSGVQLKAKLAKVQ
ncbi:excinuclease [Dyella subtropica]|uniref:excinuclease n=1 Tax=Dyella subtropica TaxID=2992127 RepID=UPI00225913C8|nr:excinuclease [Dyella subtropica]